MTLSLSNGAFDAPFLFERAKIIRFKFCCFTYLLVYICCNLSFCWLYSVLIAVMLKLKAFGMILFSDVYRRLAITQI